MYEIVSGGQKAALATLVSAHVATMALTVVVVVVVVSAPYPIWQMFMYDAEPVLPDLRFRLNSSFVPEETKQPAG